MAHRATLHAFDILLEPLMQQSLPVLQMGLKMLACKIGKDTVCCIQNLQIRGWSQLAVPELLNIHIIQVNLKT